MLEKGANPNVQNKEGNTPLHIATQKALTETIQNLLEKGANPNVQNNEGNTPLHIATQKALTETIKNLLEKGANKTIENNDGKRAFQLTEQNSKVYKLVRGGSIKKKGRVMTKSRKNVSRRKNRKSLKKQKTNRRRMSGGKWWLFGNDKLTEDEKKFLLNVEWKAPNNYPSQKLTDPINKLNNLSKERINIIINERTDGYIKTIQDLQKAVAENNQSTDGYIKTIQDLQNVAVNNQLPERYYRLYMGLNAELKDLGGA